MLDPSDPGSRAELRAWLALQRALHLDPVRATACLEAAPDPVTALRAVGELSRLRDARLDAEGERLAGLGARVLPRGSDLYPERLAALPDAPPVLVVRGRPAVLLGRAVAVVGARAPTAYGLRVARELGAALAGAGVVVVSGLARGIDAAAHRAALEAGGLTVAFSACGADRDYPPEHASLADEIARAGAVATEMPLGTPPLPHYFPLRNRLISGLSEIVVVVEARRRSGSLSTARRALDQGRDVMAVPGPIDAPTSAGPNRLLRDGAGPVCEAGDVLEALGLAARETARPERDAALPTASRRVLARLADAPASRDELATSLALPAGELALALVDLEMAGRIRRDRDGRMRVVG